VLLKNIGRKVSKKKIEYETGYERNQQYNTLVSKLHSYRYSNIIGVFNELQSLNSSNPIRVVDIGCAHARLFLLLNEKYNIDYIGIEPNLDFIKIAEERYKNHPNFKIIYDSIENQLDNIAKVDIVVALETLEHIQEHIVVRIVEKVATIKLKLFICSVPVELGPAIWFKNIGSFFAGYMRHSEYTWKETFWAGFGKLDKLPPHGISHKGFDWRWLAQTLRHNMNIVEMRKFPFNLLPAGLSTSVFFIAKPRLN